MRKREGGVEDREELGAGWVGPCGEGLSFYSSGWKPWKSVGRERAGPDSGAHKHPLVTALRRTDVGGARVEATALVQARDDGMDPGAGEMGIYL